jgi:hypothetical protein
LLKTQQVGSNGGVGGVDSVGVVSSVGGIGSGVVIIIRRQ